jgi:hypothetical protein
MLTKYKIFGERCSGTNYLQELMDMNFKAISAVKRDYGHKHFFGFRDDKLRKSEADGTLFICIVRNLCDWINSFYREKHHLLLKYKIDMSEEEKIYEFLNKEFWSLDDNDGIVDSAKEILKDRNIYTGGRYKNIFELRHIKLKWMLEILPSKVKNVIFIRYEDLLNDFESVMFKIKNKGLEIKKNIIFPLNTDYYAQGGKIHKNKSFLLESQKKQRYISNEIILSNLNLIPLYEKIIYDYDVSKIEETEKIVEETTLNAEI